MTKRRVPKNQSSQNKFDWRVVMVAVGVFLVTVAGMALYSNQPGGADTGLSFAGRPISQAQLDQGKLVYEAQCASCHGINGEGQPNWRQPDASGALPAPPHNNSGHTWHHGDLQLLSIVRNGGSMVNSNMPGYDLILSEAEMMSTLAYIKTFWGEQERAFQQEVTEQAQSQ